MHDSIQIRLDDRAGFEKATSGAGREIEKISQSTQKFGCFVATAVYGSTEAPEIAPLRAYRDYVLLTKAFGRSLVVATTGSLQA